MEIRKIVIVGNLLANPKISEQIVQEYPVFTCEDCHSYSPYDKDGWKHHDGNCDAFNGKLISEHQVACKDFIQTLAYIAGHKQCSIEESNS